MQLKNKINNKIHSKLSLVYKLAPGIFWNNWSRTFMVDPWQHKIFSHHKAILKKIKKEKPDKILEVGCGFGRNIKFFIEHDVKPEKITGSDISRGMIKKAKKNLNNNKVNLITANILNLPFKSNAYDLVLVYAVLMHVDERNISNAIDELVRVSKKNIIIVEQNYLPKDIDMNARNYTFIHNYKKIFKDKKLKIELFKQDKKYGYDYYELIV